MTDRTYTVLLYSDDPKVRDRMRLAVGTRPAADLQVEFVEADDYDACVRLVDDYEIDLMLLDGEATPAGGVGLARQIKDDRPNASPPVCLVLARAADRWLAAYAQVEGTLMFPLDPIETGRTVATMLRSYASGGPVTAA